MPQSDTNRDTDIQSTGLIIVDHGSRKEESNRRIHELVNLFREQTEYRTVQAAHMELARPSIEDAFQACVNESVRRIVLSPFFLLPGRHWQQDIPALAREASARFDDIPFLVTAPIGIHPGLVAIMQQRIQTCLASNDSSGCDVCNEKVNCRNTGSNPERFFSCTGG